MLSVPAAPVVPSLTRSHAWPGVAVLVTATMQWPPPQPPCSPRLLRAPGLILAEVGRARARPTQLKRGSFSAARLGETPPRFTACAMCSPACCVFGP